jgi:DNA polymerase-3 subunit gamma/tau
MSYQVIARKYRPQRFADVVGQEHVTRTLTNAIEQKRIAHAYLFVGPRGTGKTTIARIFAKCLNCTNGPSVNYPEDDPRCQEITEGRSLDVLEIDGASNNGVEQIRALRDTIGYAAASSKFRIYIIDEVHMLSTSAFNALLKTLEEPPAHVKFMFATTEPEKVLPTILSRCQRFDLRRIPSQLIVKHLGEIATKEGVQIDDAALHAIARGAEGGMRDAESTLDQLISFCGNTIVEADVLSMFGLAARAQILTMVAAILGGQTEVVLRELNDLSQNGKDLGRLLTDLLGHFRNLLIYKVAGNDRSFLEVSEAEAAAIAEQAELAAPEGLTRIMEVLSDGEGRLRDASSKKILIEITLLKAIQARQAVSIDSVLMKLRDLQASGPGSLPPTPAPASAPIAAAPKASMAPAPSLGASVLRETAPVRASAPPPWETAPAPSKAAPPSAPPADPAPIVPIAPAAPMAPIAPAAPMAPTGPAGPAVPSSSSAPMAAAPVAAGSMVSDLGNLWREMVEAIARASPMARAYFIKTHPISFGSGAFVIGLSPEFKDEFSTLDTPKHRTLAQTKLTEMGHANMAVRFIMAEAPADWMHHADARPEMPASPKPAAVGARSAPAAKPAEAPKPEPIQLNKEDFKNDPLIKRALEIFKGSIVEVRA